MTAALAQGSPEWRAVRCGKLTASRIADATARTKCGWGASRDNYMAELIVERLTGAPAEQYVTAAMARGSEIEPEARSAYCFHADCDVTEVGFAEHPTIAMAGCSPDGLVGADGLIEIKCPNTATHIATLLGAEIDAAYVKQMQWQMACTGRQWCDWISYDNRLPGAMSLHVQRAARDDAMIAALEKDALEFLAELDAKIMALNDRYFSEAQMAADDGLGIPGFLRRAS